MSLSLAGVSLVLGDGDQKVTVLDDVALKLAPGEFLAVVGPSGAGKSSLLAVCGGLRHPDHGQITIDGQEITRMKASDLTRLRRERIGFVFQQSNLVPALTALDQLLLMVHLRGRRPRSRDRERARALLAGLDMQHRMDRLPAQLSGGERQRVGIARALMGEPALLLVDEPTSMLDRERGRQIVGLLADQCHVHRVATMMVTHDHDMVALADRSLSMLDGRIHERSDAAH